MKLFKLSAPRPIILHHDDAFEGTFQKSDPLEEDASDEARAEHARRTERHAAWVRYLESFDTSHLDPYIRAGEKPAIFMVRPLSAEQIATMTDLPGRGAMLHYACRFGVVEILNVETIDELGMTRPLKSKRVETSDGPCLDPVSMEMFADVTVVAEVAAHVLAASRLPKGLHKSG